MEKFSILSRIQELYERGENIIKFLKSSDNRKKNSIEDILISYDFQAGTYTQITRDNPEYNTRYTQSIADVIRGLGEVNSVLEVGVGEATTLGNLMTKLPDGLSFGGFDISWSRIKYANRYLASLGKKAFLCTGDLFQAPFADSSIDVVYTSHSIEPNGGREEEALREVYRIANKYVVLLEPSFELADEKGKQRMIDNGYVTDLKGTIERLGYELVEHRLFNITINPLNPTALFVIRKNPAGRIKLIAPVCPISKTPLQEAEDHFFSTDSLLSYPKIAGIPCLTPFNAVLTSKMRD